MDFKDIQKIALQVRGKYQELETKRMGREWNLSELTEGFVVDVGDLMKLVMAKEGKRVIDNVDEKLKEEISDCLWSVLCIADKLNIDVETNFVEKMKILEIRIDNSIKDPATAD